MNLIALKPIKKKKLFEEIITAIVEYIHAEKKSPGDKLPSENELSTLFQVSKTAVREAMSVLQAKGIIEKRVGVGIFLKDLEGESVGQRLSNHLLNKQDLMEIMEFRRGIEIAAVELAAERATEKDIYNIVQAHKKLEAAHQAGKIGVGTKEDFMLHYSIILASHNSIYKEVFDTIAQKIEEVLRLSKMQSLTIPSRLEETSREHEKIIEAIRNKDPKAAVTAMRTHHIKAEEKIRSYLN